MKDLMFPNFSSDDLYELSDKELEIVLASKRKGRHKLALAVLIKYFQIKGRFPSQKELISPDLVENLANQLETSVEDFIDYDWSGSTNKRLRKQVREVFSFREACSEDIAPFKKWIKEELVPKGYTFEQDLEKSYEYFRQKCIEPFSEKQMTRYINSAHHTFEKAFFRAVFEKMSPVIKRRLDELLEEEDEKGFLNWTSHAPSGLDEISHDISPFNSFKIRTCINRS